MTDLACSTQCEINFVQNCSENIRTSRSFKYNTGSGVKEIVLDVEWVHLAED